MQAVIIIILILAILLVIFTLQNSVEISINLFLWEISNAPLVLVLLGCVLLGYIIAAVYFTPRVWKLKRERNQLQKEKSQIEGKVYPEEVEEEKNPEGIELNDEDKNEDRTFFKE
jgi:uncharacterized integral membrane protein